MTLRDALLEASTLIVRRDAETLLAHSLHHDRAWLLAHTEDDLSPKDLETFRALTVRRAAQEPLQYITGTQEFFGLTLRVTPDVLIPRPETEHLVEAVLNWAHTQSDMQSGAPQESAHCLNIPNAVSSRPLGETAAVASCPLQLADVGTGSGAIAIALASVLEHASVTAIDISPAAIAIARANATQHHLTDRIRFLQGDLLTPVGDCRFDVIASNPPYVALAEASTLAPEVRDHEPPLALYAGDSGLEIYRRLIPQAFDLLRPGGLLALEIGFGQRQSIADLLTGWNDICFLDDYASLPRVALAIRP